MNQALPAQTQFLGVIQAELRFNRKRILPYALVLLFIGNALLWWARGPAIPWGWATNSELYIVHLFNGFTFMTLPLFTALMMGDPVIRDFEVGIDPLIFSKPVSRAQYLLGKFLGNYIVLLGCQTVFLATLISLQIFRLDQMIVLPPRVMPYLKHFVFVVVVSHLGLAALCFTIGTLSRSAKAVYAFATGFYVLYISWQALILRHLPARWRSALDPLLMNAFSDLRRALSAEQRNQATLTYGVVEIANRVAMIAAAIASLAILHWVFARRALARGAANDSGLITLNLPVASAPAATVEPVVTQRLAGWPASLLQFRAVLATELRLLLVERTLIFLLPLSVLVCALSLAIFAVVPDGSFSGGYARRSAESLWLIVVWFCVFYTGAAVHRDHEVRIEPLLASAPTASWVQLLPKFVATLLLCLATVLLINAAAVVIQLARGQTPIDVSAYLVVFAIITLPATIFLAAVALFLSVLVRDKHLFFAIAVAITAGSIYLYNLGYNHWLYNPTLYRAWSYADLSAHGSNLALQRAAWLLATSVLLTFAVSWFDRRRGRG